MHTKPTLMRDRGARRAALPMSLALRAMAVGAIAGGAFAVGALAIGALAIGRLSIGRARIRSLRIDELTLPRLDPADEIPPARTGRGDALRSSTEPR